MKKSQYCFSALALGVMSLTYAAVPTFSGDLTGDEFFSNGVLLLGVELPGDQSANVGVSRISLEGQGTLTIASQRDGGYPRVTVSGGTTISSTRDWTNNPNKSWWEGQFSVPGKGRNPNPYDISYSGSNNQLAISDSYAWGLANETFSFSTPAIISFAVDEVDGQRLLLAKMASGGSWTINSADICVVEGGLCHLEIDSMSDIALVKEQFTSCSEIPVQNGQYGGVPSCIIQCDRGYEVSVDGSSCVAAGAGFVAEDDFTEEFGDLEFGDDIGDDIFNETENLEENTYEFPQGYFRYRDQKTRQLALDESLTDEERAQIRKINIGYASKNRRSTEEQVQKKTDKKPGEMTIAQKDSFINYMLNMRNIFNQQKQDEKILALTQENQQLKNEQVTLGDQTSDGNENESETLHSGAPLLPSTGPEIFVLIAIIGFLMMLFGGRKQNH